MRFNLTEAKELDVTEAYISLHVRRYEMNQDSIAVYALQTPWQWNLTWADFTERFVQPEKVTEINISKQNRGDWLHYEIDVTSQVHQWRQSPEHNHGVALVGAADACWSRTFIGSFSSPNRAHRPHLRIVHRIDDTPPTSTFLEGPLDPTNRTVASFRFEGHDEESGVAYFECNLDGGGYKGCSSPWEFHGLSDGDHTLQLRSVDWNGNVEADPREWHWEVDTEAPLLEWKTVPAAVTNKTSAFFEFAPQDSAASGKHPIRTECKLDDKNYVPCKSPRTYTQLQEGAHTLQLKVTDAAGNVAEEFVHAWEVDLDPTCQISRGEGALVSGAFDISVEWSEPVTDFGGGDFEFGGVGASVLAFQPKSGSHREFVVTVAPSADGELTVAVPRGAARDLKGTWNPGGSNKLALVADTTPPECRLLAPSSKQDGPFQITILCSERVAGLSAEAVTLSGDVRARFEAQFKASTVGTRFHGIVHPSGAGVAEIGLAPTCARDLAGNVNGEVEPIQVRVTNGNVYIVETGRGKPLLRTLGKGLAPVNDFELPYVPTSLAVDSTGSIFCATGGDSVDVFGPEGQQVNTVAGFGKASNVHISSEGLLYVLDTGRGAISVLDQNMDTLGELSGAPRPLSVAAADAIATDGAGLAYFLSAAGPEVHVFGPDLRWDRSIPLQEGSRPGGLAVDGSGRIFITYPDQGAVHALEAKTGGHLASFQPAHGEVRLSPVQIALRRDGSLLVLDGVTKAVFHMESAGNSAVQPVAGLSDAAFLATFRDVQQPRCDIVVPEGEQNNPFEISVECSEPVLELEAEDIAVSGAGGTIGGFSAVDGSNMSFTGTVEPAGVGVISFQIPERSYLDLDFNANLEPSGEVSVTFYGGQCSVSIGCQWQLAAYEHELARERQAEELRSAEEKERRLLDLRLLAESKKQALELEAERVRLQARLEAEERIKAMEKEVVHERARAEAEERIREAHATEELRQRENEKKAEQLRDTVLRTAAAVLTQIGEGVLGLLENPDRMQKLLGLASALLFSYFAAREFMRAAAEGLKKALGQPSLVRESSKYSLLARLRARGVDPSAIFGDMVLDRETGFRLATAARAIRNSHQRGAQLQHMLFYGRPGTGKTMAAERLARCCGLDYAIMSGGDVVPLGPAAVTEIHEVFRWAKSSRRGVMLFIDEAECFLQSRDAGGRMGEEVRSALNALLHQTSSQSTKFMMVLATNRPEDLDAAVLDRIDDALEFPLPAFKQREELLLSHFARCVGAPDTKTWKTAKPSCQRRAGLAALLPRRRQGPGTVKLTGLGPKSFARLADETGGFSGREIAKLMLSLQAHVFGSDGDLEVSLQVLQRVLTIKLKEHHAKGTFLEKDAAARRDQALAEVGEGGGGERGRKKEQDRESGAQSGGAPTPDKSAANGTARAVARAVVDSARGTGAPPKV